MKNMILALSAGLLLSTTAFAGPLKAPTAACLTKAGDLAVLLAAQGDVNFYEAVSSKLVSKSGQTVLNGKIVKGLWELEVEVEDDSHDSAYYRVIVTPDERCLAYSVRLSEAQ